MAGGMITGGIIKGLATLGGGIMAGVAAKRQRELAEKLAKEQAEREEERFQRSTVRQLGQEGIGILAQLRQQALARGRQGNFNRDMLQAIRNISGRTG